MQVVGHSHNAYPITINAQISSWKQAIYRGIQAIVADRGDPQLSAYSYEILWVCKYLFICVDMCEIRYLYMLIIMYTHEKQGIRFHRTKVPRMRVELFGLKQS